MENLKTLWDVIEYPVHILIILAFVFWLYRSSKAPVDNEADDPTGNSNIKKKWYDYT